MKLPALSVPSFKAPNFLRRKSCIALDEVKARQALAAKAVDDATAAALPAATTENMKRMEAAHLELDKLNAELLGAASQCELDSSKILGIPTPWFYGLAVGAVAFAYVKRDKIFKGAR